MGRYYLCVIELNLARLCEHCFRALYLPYLHQAFQQSNSALGSLHIAGLTLLKRAHYPGTGDMILKNKIAKNFGVFL
jgi:hypothetical protein